MTRTSCIIAIVISAFAQTAHAGVRVTSNIDFLEAGRAETLDLYQPPAALEKQGRKFPAFVWIHGGGLVSGKKDAAREKNIGETFAKAGYVVASIDYKLGRKEKAWPQNLHDCKNAVRFLRANAARYNIDPGRIAVGGGSAGGYLALMVGFTAGKNDLEPNKPYPNVSSAVRCVVNFYGITNLLSRKEIRPDGTPLDKPKSWPGLLRIFGVTSEADPLLRTASPTTHIDKNTVPVLTLHGRADTTVDYWQAEELTRLLEANKVPHQTIYIDGIGHTFDLEGWKSKKLPFDIKPVIFDFLDKYMQ